jgi:hypothetical protein
MQEQINPESVQFREKANQVLKAAAKAIHRPRHHHVKFPSRGSLAQRIKGRPVCTENLILFDYVTESPNVNSDDRAALLLPDCRFQKLDSCVPVM